MVLRIGGLASGIDTEQIVRDLMRVERMRVDKYFRQEEVLKWKRDALNTTNKTLAEFILKARSDFGLTRTTGTGTILRNSIRNFDWVKKVDSGDENIIKATATATAMEGSYKIEVKQLAEVASVFSENLGDVLDDNLRFDLSGSETFFTITTALGSKKIELKNAEVVGEKDITNFDFSIERDEDGNIIKDNSLKFRINGKEIVLNAEKSPEVVDINDINGLVEYIQGQLKDTGITVGSEGNRLVFTSKNEIVIESHDLDLDGNFKLETMLGLENGLYKSQNSINDIIKQINNAIDDGDGETGLGLRAAYDANLGKLMITTKEQGEDQFISIDREYIDGIAGDIFGRESAVFKEGGEGIRGKDAEFWFNENNPNENNLIKQSSNNFTMFGVNYSLQSEGTVTINVESDVDSMFDKIKEFVDNYNELIDELNGLLKEKHYRDFQPLTREEKDAMTEKEIELWEEKAKSGLLRNDETITRILQTMRDGLYGSVYDGWEHGMGGDEKRLDGFYHTTQIGIATGNYQSGGKLEINEEKLRKAIIENPEGVINLLFKTSDIKVPELGDKPTSSQIQARNNALAEKRANTGLIERLFDDMIVGMKDIVRRAGAGEHANTLRNVQSNMLIDFVTSGSISVMDRDIMDLGERIAREEMILMRREERYWSQFTAMEKALEKMNQQSVWLMSQLGQMGR